MSEPRNEIPKSPKEVIMGWLSSLDLGSDEDTREPDVDKWADRLLFAFEEHDIDVTWRPAEKALTE
jgi:hypothetical protein